MMKNIQFKMWITPRYHYKEGYAIWLVVRKGVKRKVLSVGLFAEPHQWDDQAQRYVVDRRIADLHPDRKALNLWIDKKRAEIDRIFGEFERKNIDWTVNQFEQAFFNYAAKGKIYDYATSLIATLRETGHHGNAICYEAMLRMLSLFDKDIRERQFSEIDIKYIKGLDIFMQKRKCVGNTRKYYFKALRACYNKAIQDGEAEQSIYPFGKGGFNISSLEETTAKRYLTTESMEIIKSTTVKSLSLEATRRIFLFSYYCYGISFIDAAMLTRDNIIKLNGGNYIVYKRNKTKEAKRVKPIQIKITDAIKEQLDWFAAKTPLIDDYILPLVSRSYQGAQLYNHIRSRFSRNSKNLRLLATELGIDELKLTSYVSRHTMAMTLQSNQVPREVISQILGHSDLETTATYLDSFGSSVIDEAARLL